MSPKRPQLSSEPGSGAGDESSELRQRIERHLRQLVTAGAVTGASLQLTACPPVVCDPLPPPLTCSGDMGTDDFNSWIYRNAMWISADAGVLASVTLQIELYGDAGRLAFTAVPVVQGGTLVHHTLAERQLDLQVRPDSGVDEVLITVPVDCKGIAEQLVLALDVSTAAQVGQSIPVASAEGRDQ
jgi:hypothetical protein